MHIPVICVCLLNWTELKFQVHCTKKKWKTRPAKDNVAYDQIIEQDGLFAIKSSEFIETTTTTFSGNMYGTR